MATKEFAEMPAKEVVKRRREAGQAVMERIFNAKKFQASPEEKEEIIKELREVTSPERVRDEPHILASYRGPAMTVFPKWIARTIPDMVVYPKSTAEVQQILKIASKYKIPVTVAAGQAGIGGSVPYNGGLLLELTKMNRIHKIDTEHSHVVVEPGVTVAQVMEKIRPNGYTLAKGSYYTSFSIISTQVCWMSQHNFANRMWDQVIGLEVTMPDGTILHTGSMVYGDCDHWTDVQLNTPKIQGLFMPQNGTTGVVTKAAIRIWPMLEQQAFPIFGFDDFESAYKWTHAMSKSNMVDATMVWGWPTVGLVEYKKTERYLDYKEARMNCYQDDTPEGVDLFNCFAWALMRGYKEEIEGALKTAKRLAKQYGGKYLPEDEVHQRWPNLWSYWVRHYGLFMEGESEDRIGPELVDDTVQFSGTEDAIIKLYKGLTKKFQEFNYKNWNYYTRMFNGGQTPWLRYFPRVEAESQEEMEDSLRIRNEIIDYALQNYDVTIMRDDFILNDPENPDHFIGRGQPVRRLLSAVQREFDPEGILSPTMRKYTLL